MFINEIKLNGKALRNAERKSQNGPWKFVLTQGGGKKKNSPDERWPREFFNCTAWPDVAGADQVREGEFVSVVGRLKYREWTDEQKQKRSTFEIVCSEVKPHADEPKEQKAEQPKPLMPKSYSSLEIQDSDIPF